MSKHEIKYCPRCLTEFECKVGSILLCQCSDIQLTVEERDFIGSQYEDCLCANCMKELKTKYNNEAFQTKLKNILGIFYKPNTNK